MRSSPARVMIVVIIAACIVGSILTGILKERKHVNGHKYPIGRTSEPLGKLITIQGVLVEGPSKGDENGFCLKIHMVNGRAIQKGITIPITQMQESGFARLQDNPHLPPLQLGAIYEFEGYEAGEYRGIPDGLLEKPGLPLQSPFFHFRPEFRVYQGRQISEYPVNETPFRV